MGDIVNLRTARKRKAREQDAKVAEQNRILHGRSRAQKLAESIASERAVTQLEGHRLDDNGKDET